MKLVLSLVAVFLIALPLAEAQNLSSGNLGEMAGRTFLKFAAGIPADTIRELPVQSNGRIKPFDTFARETGLFVTGSRSPLKLDPVKFYLALTTYEGAQAVECIEIRDTRVREALGFPKQKQFYSPMELENAGLEEHARPLLAKEQANSRSLTPEEKDLVEVSHQYLIVKEIAGGGHFLNAIDFAPLVGAESNVASDEAISKAKRFLTEIAGGSEAAPAAGQELIAAVRNQPVPELFKGYKSKIGLEVLCNKLHPFLIAGILYFCLGLLLLAGFLKNRSRGLVAALFSVPLFIHVLGFATRVYITGFAPVTNMYGTMLWVAFGVALFSLVLMALYGNQILVGLLVTGSSLVLLLTEGFPLILSPDMDPVVAVLRSNYWLTLHVLTITISYAAFTICMLIGNFALLKTVAGTANEAFYKTYSHYVYRMMQLGVFLITAGIILGGIWADYSWGRFWGWDPKETWALIADMGFLMILHARFTGWLRSFGILALAPVAYLLVIMAWYGVNFILAAGLHSYGFSSGGATAVAVFVTAQLTLVIWALVSYRRGYTTARSALSH